MTDQNKRAVYLIAALVAVIIVLEWLSRRNAVQVVPAENDQFTAPYFWPNGIYPGVTNMNGGISPFESTVNVYVDNPALAGLSNQYIPMFGFVGMTAVKG